MYPTVKGCNLHAWFVEGTGWLCNLYTMFPGIPGIAPVRITTKEPFQTIGIPLT